MKRAPYFSELPIPNNLVTVEREIRLWRAVIDQALLDFLSDSKVSENVANKERAKIWLRGKTDDFLIVCDYAQLNAKEARELIFNIIGGIDELYK